MRCQLSIIACAIALSVTAPSASVAVESAGMRRVPLSDVRYAAAQDITAELRSSTVRRELPFNLHWNGQAYRSLEIGIGWVRGVPAGEIQLGQVSVVPVGPDLGKAREVGLPRPTTFDVLAGPVTLGPAARVLVEASPFEVAIRWWGLRMPGVSGDLAAEIIINRVGPVRFQYLQVAGLKALLGDAKSPAPSALRIGAFGPGTIALVASGQVHGEFQMDNGAAYELAPGLAVSIGPPPPGCVAPTENWCQVADGPGMNSVIHLDTNFEEVPPQPWVFAPSNWHIIPFATCTPGAVNNPGSSAYVGNDVTCRHPTTGTHTMTSPTFASPTGANGRLTFAFRAGYNFPLGANLLILANGMPFVQLGDPNTQMIDPDLWYVVNPITVPAGTTTVGFRFTTSPASNLGAMVDDVFVYEEVGTNINCVREAIKNAGQPQLANCSDTVHTDWAFNERGWCTDCPYTFYIRVECGTSMHLPLSDMEGAEVTITDVVNPANILTLTCENTAFRDPMNAPLLLSGDCCPPGMPDGIDEEWYGPAWNATAPNTVEWGFSSTPQCPLVGTAYDLDMNGLTCDELVPACGGVLSRVSPGELQDIDCFIEGDPGLCGLFRVDVRSGGFEWNLFSNCTGSATPTFDIYYNCEDAWAAFNPLPEIAVANVRDVGTCPNTMIEYELQNLGCADLAGDLTVRATSSCSPPDVASWLVPGLGAGATRVDTMPMTVSCMSATITVQVDPADAVLECSESPTSAACAVIPGADEAMGTACAGGCLTSNLGSIDQLKAHKDPPGVGPGVTFVWLPDAPAVEYHVNAVDDKLKLNDPDAYQIPRGMGTLECTGIVGPTPTCTDGDALTDARLRVYYQAFSACGLGGLNEGPL